MADTRRATLEAQFKRLDGPSAPGVGGKPGPSRLDALSPDEHNVLKYARDRMLNGQAITNPDGTITSFKGARMSFDDGTVMLFPTFWDGKVIADPHVAMQKAIASGIRWPIYKDDATAAAAESKIHRIMESDSDVAQGRVK